MRDRYNSKDSAEFWNDSELDNEIMLTMRDLDNIRTGRNTIKGFETWLGELLAIKARKDLDKMNDKIK